MQISLKQLSHDQLHAWLSSQGQGRFRLPQIQQWLYRKWVTSAAEMTTLPAALRQRLEAEFTVFSLHCEQSLIGDDGTRKYLFRLDDGEHIETVLLQSGQRLTVCISTQVGCDVGCAFCASGRDGCKRDLTVAEIVDQVIYACRQLGERVTNIVVMGMGEPLLNVGNLIAALDLCCAETGLGFAQRNITVSTSGIVPGIYALAAQGKQWNLALSLHAGSDATRQRLIPAKHRWPLAEVLTACEHYRQQSGRMFTFEYALLAGVNDSIAEIDALAALAKRRRAKVNLIPFNATHSRFTAPSAAACEQICTRLSRDGVQVTLRRERGRDISAACGQLRRNHLLSS